jgi:hypothetical protein
MPLPVSIPISKHLSADALSDVTKHIDKTLEGLISQWRTLHTQKITAWRRVYRAVPRERYKSFPWKGAANLVPTIVSSFVDQLTARVVMGLYGVDPLFPAGLVGTFSPEENAEEQRIAIETWMSYAGKSPEELNLFHSEYAWFSNAIKYGFAALKHPWEHQVEQVAEAVLDSKVVFRENVKYDGPRPTPILFEDFLINLRATDFRSSNFIAHRVKLNEMELNDRAARGLYPKKKIDTLLAAPDRYGADEAQKNMEMDISGGSSSTYAHKEWDVHECYFPFLYNGQMLHIIASYHRNTKTLLRAVFNFFPDNMVPFKLARLGTDGESILGRGFCELLGAYQEEIAQIHNQRRDAGTLANTTIIRAARSSQLDTQFSVYPMAVLPGEQGEFEFIQIGRSATETIKEEQMTLQLAQDAAGVGPSSAGSGAGTVNKKGAYSAMGSFATQQEGNTRANLHQTTTRYAHLCLGNDLLKLYAHYGIDLKKVKSLGKMGENLQKALENVRNGRICIPIYAATGSINKEIEKQNQMLMLQNVRQHWQMQAQLMQQLDNPMVPPDMKKYAMEVFTAGNLLMANIMKDFNVPDPSRMLPDGGVSDKLKQLNEQEAAQKMQQMLQQAQQAQQGGQEQGVPPQQGNGPGIPMQQPAQPEGPAQ